MHSPAGPPLSKHGALCISQKVRVRKNVRARAIHYPTALPLLQAVVRLDNHLRLSVQAFNIALHRNF